MIGFLFQWPTLVTLAMFKNAEALERFEKVDTLAVDKTGTLTEGKPKVVAVRAVGGVVENELLRIAASLT